MTEIIVAVITGIATVVAVVITNALEKNTAVLEDKIKSAQHIDTDLCGWSCD